MARQVQANPAEEMSQLRKELALCQEKLAQCEAERDIEKAKVAQLLELKATEQEHLVNIERRLEQVLKSQEERSQAQLQTIEALLNENARLLREHQIVMENQTRLMLDVSKQLGNFSQINIGEQQDELEKKEAGKEAKPNCEICLEPYSQDGEQSPRVLACGHTICMSCAKKIAKVEPDWHVRCPFDRLVTDLYDSLEGGIPKNYSLLRYCP